jgi:type IV pilus assembly protein PilM
MKSFLAAAAPAVAVDIGPGRIAAAALGERGGRAYVAGHAAELLADGVVVPSLNATNITDRAVVIDALKRVFDRLGTRPRRIGLVIPDSAAKVSLIRFEQIPTRPQDLDQLVRLMVRKTAPFRIEDAQVSYAPGMEIPAGSTISAGSSASIPAPTAASSASPPATTQRAGREFAVALARRDIVEEYEAVCAAAGAHAGLVDLATFNIINAMLAGAASSRVDTLLVHVTTSYITLAIVRGQDLIFYRNRGAEEEGSLADLVHQTAMYYEDRLSGGGFARVVLAGATTSLGTAENELLRRSLEDRLGTRVEPVDPRPAAALTDRIAAGPGLLDTLAPLVGILVRERAA